MRHELVNGLFFETTLTRDLHDNLIARANHRITLRLHSFMNKPNRSANDFVVIAINDKTEGKDELCAPNETQIIDFVSALWKEDPLTEALAISKLHQILKGKHPRWTFSEKRLKNAMRMSGLLVSADQELFVYSDRIKSFITPNSQIPDSVEIKMTKDRGNGVYAKTMIKKGDLIWQEAPLFLIPPLAHASLISFGKACTYCGGSTNDISRSKAGISVLKGLDCNWCQDVWCSPHCKKANAALHPFLKHPSQNRQLSRKFINLSAFFELVHFCVQNQWSSLHAVTLIHANTLLDKAHGKGVIFESMASVSQLVRYQAAKSSAGAFDPLHGGISHDLYDQEALWREGYLKFCEVFPAMDDIQMISFQEFLLLLGRYSLNAFDSSIYQLQSQLNHDCSPNVEVLTSLKRFEGISVVAAQDIPSGLELTMAYVNLCHTVQQRRRELRVNWGFLCNCRKCEADLKIQQRRKSSSGSFSDDRHDLQAFLRSTLEPSEAIEFELGMPTDFNGQRRKSVRFDDKVIKVT